MRADLSFYAAARRLHGNEMYVSSWSRAQPPLVAGYLSDSHESPSTKHCKIGTQLAIHIKLAYRDVYALYG